MFNEPVKLNSNISKIDSKSIRKTSISQLRSKNYSSSIPNNNSNTTISNISGIEYDENINIPTLKINKDELLLINWSWNYDITNQSILKDISNKNFLQDQIISKTPLNQINSIISIFNSLQFWQLVHDDIKLNHPTIFDKFPSIAHQSIAFSNVFKMLIVSINQDDFNHLNYYLHKLGKLHGRIFNIESKLFEILCNSILDTLIDKFTINYFNINLQNVYIKLFQFISEFMIQSYLNDPVLTLSDSPLTDSIPIQIQPQHQIQQTINSHKLPTSNSSTTLNNSPTNTASDNISIISTNTYETINKQTTITTQISSTSNINSLHKKKSRLSKINFNQSRFSRKKSTTSINDEEIVQHSRIPRFAASYDRLMKKK